MTVISKTVLFKGLSQKERILFKSFINLVRGDLVHPLELVSVASSDSGLPDLLIVDAEYELTESEQYLKDVPALRVGQDIRVDESDYIHRPVQWSEFQHAIKELELQYRDAGKESVLPTNLQLVMGNADSTIIVDDDLDRAQDPIAYDLDKYEIEIASSSYASVVDTSMARVIEDVEDFENNAVFKNGQAAVLATDEEGGVRNSMLVLDSELSRNWDANETIKKASSRAISLFDELASEQTILEERIGFEIEHGERFWTDDNELIANNRSVFFIRAQEQVVFSQIEPALWPRYFKEAHLTKLPLSKEWQPKPGMDKYPISDLKFSAVLGGEESSTSVFLNSDVRYTLTRWPEFYLLELDNELLKLCTYLYVGSQSIASLVKRTGYDEAKIRGLMLACYQSGYLRLSEKVARSANGARAPEEESMLSKIIDVFS